MSDRWWKFVVVIAAVACSGEDGAGPGETGEAGVGGLGVAGAGAGGLGGGAGAAGSPGGGSGGMGAGSGGTEHPSTQDIYDEIKEKAVYVSLAGKNDASCGGIQNPCRTIQFGVEKVSAGQGLVIRGGLYREAVNLTKGGQPGLPLTIVSYPGEQVTISGATVVEPSGWQTVAGVKGTVYKRSYPHALYEHPSKARPQDQMRPEMVLVDGIPMLTIYLKAHIEQYSLAELPGLKFTDAQKNSMKWKAPDMATLLGPEVVNVQKRGVIFVEGSSGSSNKTVYARFPGEQKPGAFKNIQLGARGFALRGSVGNVRVVGLTLENVANTAKKGALDINGKGWLLRDVNVRWSNGVGITVKGDDHRFVRVRSNHHGQMGFFTTGHDNSIYESVEASFNNWKNYDVRWEAGGGKWTNSNKNIFKDYYAEGNNGIGLWLDIANYNNTIEGARIIDNRFIGIHIEHFTENTFVKDCIIFGTRYHRNHFNGSDESVGLRFSHASKNTVENCTIYSNDGDGLVNKYTDSRGPSLENKVRKNLILNNTLSKKFSDSEIRIEAKTAAHVKEGTYQGNVYGAPSGDPVFGAGYGFSGSYTGSDVATWMAKTGATGEKRLSSNQGVLKDLTTATGYQIVDSSLAGVGSSLK